MAGAENQKMFITGGSRYIGAETGLVFAENGWDVGFGATRESTDYRKTMDKYKELGVEPYVQFADITLPESRDRLVSGVLEWADNDLSALILNAAGGLERDKGPGYGMVINRDAQVALAEKFSMGMAPNGSITFVNSSWGHWWDRGLKLPPFEISGKTYEVVASSKHAGETALRAMIPDLAARDTRLLVAVAGYVPDSLIGRLGKRSAGEFVEGQKDLDNTPDMRAVAEFIFGMVNNPNLESGATGIIGADEETFLKHEMKESE